MHAGIEHDCRKMWKRYRNITFPLVERIIEREGFVLFVHFLKLFSCCYRCRCTLIALHRLSSFSSPLLLFLSSAAYVFLPVQFFFFFSVYAHFTTFDCVLLYFLKKQNIMRKKNWNWFSVVNRTVNRWHVEYCYS